jgi:NAD(P)-dependent dehydrogenase (short-subunit alcohol dehydrogenase family)
MARRFAEEGAAVVVGDIDEAGGERVVAAIAAAGGRARFVTTDVSQAAACARLVESAVAEFGRLDVMVNNAGVGSVAPIAELEEAEWDRILTVDLKGVFLGAKYAFPALVTCGGGVILNMASVAGQVAAPGFGAYGVAKAGVIHLTRVLALEGAPYGIRANALCPTWCDTPLVRSYLDEDPQPHAARLRLEESIPLGRLGAPEDVASAALYLASDEAAFVTGVTLEVDGGVTAR